MKGTWDPDIVVHLQETVTQDKNIIPSCLSYAMWALLIEQLKSS